LHGPIILGGKRAGAEIRSSRMTPTGSPLRGRGPPQQAVDRGLHGVFGGAQLGRHLAVGHVRLLAGRESLAPVELGPVPRLPGTPLKVVLAAARRRLREYDDA
jgi:hypothetical protein